MTVEGLADISGLDVDYVGECLRVMQQERLVYPESERVLWGFGTVTAYLWKLSLSDQCLDVMARLPRPTSPARCVPEQVPAQFWSLFCSGTHPAELRIPEDGLAIAGRMIESEDTAARAWALTNLPPSCLRALRTMRGYDENPTATRIDVMCSPRADLGGW